MAPTPDYLDTSYYPVYRKPEKTAWEKLEEEKKRKQEKAFNKAKNTFRRLKNKR